MEGLEFLEVVDKSHGHVTFQNPQGWRSTLVQTLHFV